MTNTEPSVPVSPVSSADFGPFAELARRPAAGVPGKSFLSEALGLTGCEISLNRIPAGRGYPFTHKHRRNEEVYVVVGGRGTFYADGRAIPLREGSVVRLAPEVDRTLGAADDSHLDYICFQAPQGGMPYTFLEDGVPTSVDVPFANPLPLPDRLREFFAH